jgi:hypothetical protein
MCGILILADLRPIWGVSFHAVVVFGLGKDFLLEPVPGKSLSEALILVSINPQYDKRLFIDLPVQYMLCT